MAQFATAKNGRQAVHRREANVPPMSSDRIRREVRAGRETDPLLVWMVRNGIPVTRDEYIKYAYFGNAPSPWTPQLEAKLPVCLRNWPWLGSEERNA